VLGFVSIVETIRYVYFWMYWWYKDLKLLILIRVVGVCWSSVTSFKTGIWKNIVWWFCFEPYWFGYNLEFSCVWYKIIPAQNIFLKWMIWVIVNIWLLLNLLQMTKSWMLRIKTFKEMVLTNQLQVKTFKIEQVCLKVIKILFVNTKGKKEKKRD
jgi:hypothetical protein